MPHFKTTKVARHCNTVFDSPDHSILVEQGGARSGKTYNILNWIIINAYTKWDGYVVDIVRKSFPTLRQSVMFDFFKILETHKLYSEKNHNKTENIYKIGTNKIRFFSCDDSQKMRGPGRDILFCNEANELRLEDYRQLNMRCRVMTVLDYNPSDEFHWIYDQVIPRDDCVFEQTTYNDNTFLDKRIVQEIEAYKDIDENFWRIYGLGERGISSTSIYTKWDLVDELPEGGEVFFGLDFGYNHPTALVKLVLIENNAYIHELLYKPYLTNQDLIDELKSLNISSNDTIYGDCSRPEMIEEIHRAGFNIHPTKKGADSVKDGIDHIKRCKIHLTKESVNLLKEIKSYKWKVDKDERVLDEPVKINDDAMDAMRYSFNEKIQGTVSYSIIEDFSF